jgi:transposase
MRYAHKPVGPWAGRKNPARLSSIANRSRPARCAAGSGASTKGKKIWGRKRVLLVDTQGFLLAVLVLAANIAEREAAILLLQDLIGRFPRIRRLFADQGYSGPLIEWIKMRLGWETEILTKSKEKPPEKWVWEAVLIDGQVVPRPKRQGRGFELQPQRWKIERTFGWLIRFRRLARDYESLPESSEAMIQIAAIRLLLTRLASF